MSVFGFIDDPPIFPPMGKITILRDKNITPKKTISNKKKFFIIFVGTIILLGLASLVFSKFYTSIPKYPNYLKDNIYPKAKIGTPTPKNKPTSEDNKETVSFSYLLPTGWLETSEPSGKFTFAYDPNLYATASASLGIKLICLINDCRNFTIKTIDYDGGPRDEFIRKSLNINDLNLFKNTGTREVDFVYEGRSGLFYYNFGLAGKCTVGMLKINSAEALLIESASCEKENFETIIRTIKTTSE